MENKIRIFNWALLLADFHTGLLPVDCRVVFRKNGLSFFRWKSLIWNVGFFLYMYVLVYCIVVTIFCHYIVYFLHRIFVDALRYFNFWKFLLHSFVVVLSTNVRLSWAIDANLEIWNLALWYHTMLWRNFGSTACFCQ